MISSYSIFGQKEDSNSRSIEGRFASANWAYCFDWSAGDPISSTIGTITLNQSPSNQNIYSCINSTINFSARFGDLDDASCSKGVFKKQFPLSDYNIKFESSSNYAVFKNGTTTITNVQYQIQEFNNPFLPSEKFDVFLTKPVSLTILPGWTGAKIDVTVTVTDLGASLPSCHTGDPKDSQYSYTWSIYQATQIPTNLVKVNSIPLENTWTLYSPPLYNQGGLAFYYRGMPKSPPTYEAVIVIEEFPSLTSGGIFTMSDLTIEWKNAHPDILDPDEAAKEIFIAGLPNSFVLNNNNEFEDFHAGFALNTSMISNIFTSSAILNKRVGYKYDQKFSSCSNNLGTAEIWRRIDTGFNVELKKKHNL